MNLEEAKKIILDKKPVLKKLYEKYKNKSWIDYSLENYNIDIKNLEIKKLETALEKILSPILGEDKTKRTINTVRKTGVVSTADHHGILCHSFFHNSSIVRSDPRILSKDKSVISFTCGCVSPTNSSLPRGIFFHDDEMNLIKMFFLSLRRRRRPLYGIPSISKQKFEKEYEKISFFNINNKRKEKLKIFFKSIIENDLIFEQKRFSDQITIINDILWNKLFKNERANLVYIEIESVMREIILDDIYDKESLIYKIIFDECLRKKYINNFENITGAHSTKEKRGSHIFWYIDEIKNTRIQLWIKDNHLVSEDGEIKIKLNSEIMREYLLRYELMPSMAFCYSIMAFEFGLTLGGGFSQIQYLGGIKDAFEKTLSGSEFKIKKPRTDVFTGEFSILSIGNNLKKEKATLFDLLIHSDNPNELVSEEMEKVTIGESLDFMMDEFVEIVTGKKEKIDIEYRNVSIRI